MSDAREIPTGRLSRLARVAAAGLRGAARSEAAGQDLYALLGGLRGLPAKLGQMAAYVDGLGDAAGAMSPALLGLLSRAPRSSTEAVRAAVHRALGAPVDHLFSDWEDEPLASASIGQVHRARLADGRRVAVKVQHPGIGAAIDSDLANIAALERAGSALGGGKLETAALVSELAARLREELDYRAEAAHQERFRQLHLGDPKILVPAVVPERSADTVLTTELAPGLDFEAACAAPESERAAWCRTLWRFVYKGTVKAGIFNADPHPGNYLFQDDGAVVFLDFGCVQTVPEPRRAADEALHRAALARDEASFADAARALLALRGGAHERRAIAQVRAMYEPLFHPSFRVTRPFAAGLLAQMARFAREARRSDEPVPPLPPGTLFMNRLQFGFYSVLARLDAEVAYAAVERALLDEPAP